MISFTDYKFITQSGILVTKQAFHQRSGPLSSAENPVCNADLEIFTIDISV